MLIYTEHIIRNVMSSVSSAQLKTFVNGGKKGPLKTVKGSDPDCFIKNLEGLASW